MKNEAVVPRLPARTPAGASTHVVDTTAPWNFSTGGGTGAAGTVVLTAQSLDAIPTVNLPAGLIVFFALSTAVKFCVLTAGTDAEASPTVIRLDDFAAGSNEKVWKVATVG